jgi:hypothetical protein
MEDFSSSRNLLNRSSTSARSPVTENNTPMISKINPKTPPMIKTVITGSPANQIVGKRFPVHACLHGNSSSYH